MIFNTGAAAGSSADKIKYDNTTSGLESTEVQGALDEIASNAETTNANITVIQTNEKAQVLTFTSKSIATSAWTSSTLHTDYPYYANIACIGMTTDHIPFVSLPPNFADTGNFASVARSMTNGVAIYAKEKPTSTISGITVVAMKAIT